MERILVTGSSGHLGEGADARAARGRARRRRPRRAGVAVHGRRRLGRRPRLRAARHCAGVDRGGAHRHAAQAARRHRTRAQDFVRHEHHGHARRCSRRPSRRAWTAFVFTSTTSAFGRALVPRRASRRRGSRRTSCPCRATSTARRRSPPRTCASSCTATTGCRACPAHVALLPGGRRPRRRALRATSDAEPQGQRAAVPARRPRGRRSSAHLRALERAPAARLRPLHRQRHDAVRARRPARSCARDAAAVVGGTCRRARPSTRHRGWRMFGEHRARLRQRAGARQLGWAPRVRLRARGRARRRGRGPAQRRSRGRSARRATTSARTACTRRASRPAGRGGACAAASRAACARRR